MHFSFSQLSLSIAVLLNTGLSLNVAYAGESQQTMDVITVTGSRHQGLIKNESFALGKTSEPDLAHWLSSVPGANVNSNGPLTGIAQYRGLYGDRVAAVINGHPMIGAGPNAMDTPLSYSTPLLVDSMTVYRGVAPVTIAMNTIGGAIDVQMRKAQSLESDELNLNGDVQAGYRSNNSAHNLSGVANLSKGDFAVMLYGNNQEGDDITSGDDYVLSPTSFDKNQFGGDIRYDNDGNEIGLNYNYTKTIDSGTPALPMDIEYIESQFIGLDGAFSLGEWQANWQIGYFDADHAMTNYLMRANSNPQKYRRNVAVADTTDFKVTLDRQLSFGRLLFGVDGYFATHDSVIGNPNNAMFELVNFNKVKDDNIAVFTQWSESFEQTDVQFGVRLKQSKANAGEVSTSMAMTSTMATMSTGMPTMGQLSGKLMDDFNNADRKVSDTSVDVALNTQTLLDEALTLSVGLGLKSRAPSYQERYLWMPMESTGGLADGNTYIGDINLSSETALQADLGLTYQTDVLMFSPHIFYQNIDDYIQGTPLTPANKTAGSIATMMSGSTNTLKFSNVDAKIYGADINWYYNINEQFQFSGIASYVRGERVDIDDNLYRIAPLNATFIFTYHKNSFASNLTLVAVDDQKQVSQTNNEKTTHGYGLVNIDVDYTVTHAFSISAGVDNILNREYQNHLGGYNRVKEVDIPVMTRLSSEGLSAWAEITYSF